MNGLFADTGVLVENGYFSYYYANRLLEEQGRYVLRKKDGLWVSYYPDGMMRDSVYYANGQKIKSFSWYSNGYLRDSSSFDEYGTGIDVGWFNNGNPSYAGLYKGGQKNAKWKYFHKNGNLAALEMYDMGNIKEVSYFDEAGNPQTVKYSPIDTLIRPFFAGSRDGKKWVNYLYSHVYFPPHYQIKNSDKVTILVSFTVTEEGGVSDVDIIVPFAPQFDQIVKKIMENSPPLWTPALHHNRKIATTLRQPLTFANHQE